MEDPVLDARRADVFWDPMASRLVLPLDASPASDDARVNIFRLDRIEIPTTVIKTPDGLQHVLFADGGRALQLAVRGTDMTAGGVVLRHDALPPAPHLRTRLDGLRKLSDLDTTGRLRLALHPSYAGAHRLQRVLQALDGWLAKASQREIAIALVGEARVGREWRDAGEHLRDQVRRAVRRGRLLMAGGYRRFLR